MMSMVVELNIEEKYFMNQSGDLFRFDSEDIEEFGEMEIREDMEENGYQLSSVFYDDSDDIEKDYKEVVSMYFRKN